MSLCELGSSGVHVVGNLASTEELAIVPDLQRYHYIVGNSQNYKYSDCFSREELLVQNQQDFDFSGIVAKRHCSSYSINHSPESFQPSNCSDTAETYLFGTSKDKDILPCASSSAPVPFLDFTSSSSSKGSSAKCEQGADSQVFSSGNLLPDMQQPQALLSHRQGTVHSPDKYELIIKEQPEEYYRARYDSEGVRAPLKGFVENYPAVQIFGPDFKCVRIDVKLVHEDGTPHMSCSLDASEGRKNAVIKKIGPCNHKIAEFEDLRIRRVKKEGRKKSTGCDKSTHKDGRSDKIASLLFTAIIETDQGEIVQSVKSRSISLTTAPEPAELDWLEPNRGHFSGQESLVIKGSKMTSPKVTFRILLPDGRRQELHGSVDKDRSHQNVLLVKTPSLNQLSHHFAHQQVRAEVIVITGRYQMPSNSLPFDFIPNNICRDCMQETPQSALISSTYTVCSPAIPSYPISAAAVSSSGHSPPPTPGLPPQPSPTALRAQMQQTSNPMQLPSQSHPNYSQALQTPMTIMAPSDRRSPSTSTRSLIPPPLDMVPNFQEGDTTSISLGNRGGDDLMCIMRDLMEQDTNSAGIAVHHRDMESHYMFSDRAYRQQLDAHVSSHYIPVSSPSVASDRPCYSPITPVQSPLPMSPWNYIEQTLTTLLRTEQITRPHFMVLQEKCIEQNPYMLQAFNASQSNETVFLQMLASNKLDQSSFQTTHQ